MSRRKLRTFTFGLCSCIVALLLLLPSSFLRFVQCQIDDRSPPQLPSPTSLEFLTAVAYSSLENLTSDLLSSQLVKDYSFCIQNPEAEWNTAFNYSSDTSFLTGCLGKNGDVTDVTQRLCTAGEVDAYFGTFKNGGSMKPNRNCNSSYWVAGCEPGWACKTDTEEEQIDLKSREIPGRGSQCGSCCEGFFCPRGIACMIPCPLGSYCPLATLDNSTGRCHPTLQIFLPTSTGCAKSYLWWCKYLGRCTNQH